MKAHFIVTLLLFGLFLCGPFVPDYAVHLLFLSAAFVTAILLSAEPPRIRRGVMLLGGMVLIGMICLKLTRKEEVWTYEGKEWWKDIDIRRQAIVHKDEVPEITTGYLCAAMHYLK